MFSYNYPRTEFNEFEGLLNCMSPAQIWITDFSSNFTNFLIFYFLYFYFFKDRKEGPTIIGDVFIHSTAKVDPSAVIGWFFIATFFQN